MEFPIISSKVFLGVIMESSAGQEMVGRVNSNAAHHETLQA